MNMNDVILHFATGFGQYSPIVLGIVACLLITKGAIVVAVHQAGRRELEVLKSQLEERLSARREEFERELSRATEYSAQQLEAFKAELQLATEVRRQAAAKKVEVLVSIGRKGEALQRDVLNAVQHDELGRVMRGPVYEYNDIVRNHAFLFDKSVAARLQQYAADLLRAHNELNYKYDASALGRAFESVDRFLEEVRKELGVTKETKDAA